MKNVIIPILLLATYFSFGQIQENAPWAKDFIQQNRNNTKPTLKEVSAAAEAYFSTIDINKKGSGYKPFKRWEYNKSFYLNFDGTLASKEDLIKSWEEKRERNRVNRMTDESNWTPIGPYSNANTYSAANQKQTGQGRVNAILVDPNNSSTYYVGTPAGGLWRSTDSGLNWVPLTDNLPQIGVSGIAVHPTNSNIIYIATGDDDADDTTAIGVWKTTDGGTTWNNTGDIPGNPNSMNEIFIFPNNPETVIVATSSGIQKTTNGGTSWTTKLNGNIIDLRMKPNDPSTWYAVSSNTFYKSSDNGETFTSRFVDGLSGSTRLMMSVTPANNSYVYLVSAGSGSAFNGVYKSSNSGESFTKTNQASSIFGSSQAWFDLAITASSTNAEIVYVGVLDIWKSTNGGNNFTKINDWANPNTPDYTHADIHFLKFMDGKFFAGTDGGIFVSSDEGNSFIDLTKNLAISQFYRISVSEQDFNVVNGGIQDNGGYGRSGNEWRNYHGGDGMEGVINPTNSNIFYGFMQFGQNLFYSNDGGRTLTGTIARPSGESGRWVSPLVSNSQGIIYSGFNQIYKLENNSWSQVSTHSFSGTIYHIEIDPNNDNNIYASRSGTLYKSSDAGVTFTTIPLSFGTINSIEIHNSDSNIGWIVTNIGVYKSTNLNDASPTFNPINTNIPSEGKSSIKHHNRSGNNTLYLGTTLGVYSYNDDTNAWETFHNNLPNTLVSDLAINEEDAKLIAGTYGRGVFISDIPQQLPENDVRLISINTPTIGVNCGSNIVPQITVKNQGTQELTSITVNYNIDGGTNSTFTWTGNLSSEATTTIMLPEITNINLGIHTLNVETTITNDTYNTNNSRSSSFLINESDTNPTVANSFETSNDILLTETNNSTMWERGRVNKTLLTIPNGNNAYSTKITGNYPDQTVGYLYTNCYNLTNMSNPELAFKMGFDIENEFDYMLVEYSTDFGANWEILGSASDLNWYNNSATVTPQGASLPGKQWTGLGETVNFNDGMTNATIRDYSYDLSAFSNETNIIFRFKFFTDQNTNEEGAVIDDLVINGVLSTDSFNLLNNIAIYPNPSESIFNLNWNTGDTLDIKVYDITGKQVFAKRNITNNSYQLDLGSFAQGIYLLNMNMNGKTATKKLVLK